MKKIIVFTYLLTLINLIFGQGLVVNEFSNGPTTNQEYYEYVVVGPTGNPNCGPIDIRGWIIDDNNGDFSCGPVQNVGIAQGHVRFANNLNWASVPTGTIILVYNDAVGEKNPAITLPDDPTDANLDLVYVVPISSTLFDKTSGNNTCPVALNDQIPMACDTLCSAPTGTSAYTPVVYSAGGSWIQISMANAADASQTRLPGGAYFHGVAYGSATLMNGGPNNLHFAGSGAGRCYSLTNGTSTDFRNILNWTRGNAPGNETPGFGNSPNNISWINSLRTPCPLPVIYYKELSAYENGDENILEWSTITEINSDRYEILRSSDAKNFNVIGSIESKNQTNEIKEYKFIDENPYKNSYYQISQIDKSGDENLTNIVQLQRTDNKTSVNIYPNPTEENFTIEVDGKCKQIIIYDIIGNKIISENVNNSENRIVKVLNFGYYKSGIYVVEVKMEKNSIRKLIVKK